MSNYEQDHDNVVQIKIVGVGGGGTNAVERMMKTEIPLVDYVTINTDDGGYQFSHAKTKVQIGLKETKGRGAGADPEKGSRSAQENRKEIEDAIQDCDMVFIASGMGGGTGTGAAPVVAEIAKKHGILTVAIVTTPFAFEGKKRMDNALGGIEALRKNVDALIIIPNDNLKYVADARVSLNNAFELVDDVLVQTVRNLVEVIQNTACINCDFADVCSIVRNSGDMYTAIGIATGSGRAAAVAEQIKSSKLLGSKVDGATGIMLCVTAAKTIGLDEIDEITSSVAATSPDANLIFGMNFDDTMNDTIKVVLLATKK